MSRVTTTNANAIINNFLAWNHGHIVAAVLSSAQLGGCSNPNILRDLHYSPEDPSDWTFSWPHNLQTFMLGVLYNSVPVYQSGIYAGGALQFSTRISVGDIHINRVYNNYLLLQGLIPCSTVWSLVVLSEISGPLMSSNPLADIFIFLMFLIGKSQPGHWLYPYLLYNYYLLLKHRVLHYKDYIFIHWKIETKKCNTIEVY